MYECAKHLNECVRHKYAVQDERERERVEEKAKKKNHNQIGKREDIEKHVGIQHITVCVMCVHERCVRS